MRAAVIGDIHANLPALLAVLEHARSQSIDEIWNIGDSTGYGAFPEEVIRFLMESEIISIQGNYDAKVLNFKHKKEKWKKNKLPEKWLAFKFAYEQLSTPGRLYLQSLPQEITLERAGKRLLLTHGSPGSPEEHLTPETPQSRLREIAQKTPADIILCGHSHIPFTRVCDNTWFINTGSVGRPDDGDARASYVIVELSPKRITTVHYRIPYNVDQAVNAVREHNLPEAFAQMTLRGYSLEEILRQNQVSAATTSEDLDSP